MKGKNLCFYIFFHSHHAWEYKKTSPLLLVSTALISDGPGLTLSMHAISSEFQPKSGLDGPQMAIFCFLSFLPKVEAFAFLVHQDIRQVLLMNVTIKKKEISGKFIPWIPFNHHPLSNSHSYKFKVFICLSLLGSENIFISFFSNGPYHHL